MQKSDIESLVLEAMQELNFQQEADKQLEIALETPLFGRHSKLDSLGLVNLIVMVEEKIADQLNVPITLADERAMSQKNSPFRTAQTLSDYAFSLAQEA